ncbi:MAG: apolipoprotein N-acyltransferase, partial [Alphaproteobacteria bacterium]|nr:apolipoprotein N-acyltransferase [Alphaproteobacteria bacterium]
MPDLPLSLAFEARASFGPLQRLAAAMSDLTGWRRHGAAILLGALGAAALPPVDIVPLLILSFTGLVWLAEGCRRHRDAFALGWSFGFGLGIAGLYWIAAALFVDIAAFWWLLPFAVAGLPALLALYSGLAVLGYRAMRPRGIGRALALAACWAAAEWLRGHLLTGFPWNLAGYAWSGGFPGATMVLQITSVIGIYGLSLLTVAAAAAPASLGDPPLGPTSPAHRFGPPLAALLLVLALAGGGWVRLAGAATGSVPGVVLRLVQPSIPETLKWDPAARESNFQRLLALSAA